MKIKNPIKVRLKSLEDWHDWFAWRPVCIDGEIVWLQFIKRRVFWHPSYAQGDWETEYKI